jgi:tetratricopeptide (TPR) repeat protein
MLTKQKELLTRAIQLRAEKRFDESKSVLNELLILAPDDASYNYHMAWLHDNLGLEEQAILYYEKALNGELSSEEKQGALLGFGSTLRCLGKFDRSVEIFNEAIANYPENASFKVFLALSQFELGHTKVAFSGVLKQLALTTGDTEIARYKRALLEVADAIMEE